MYSLSFFHKTLLSVLFAQVPQRKKNVFEDAEEYTFAVLQTTATSLGSKEKTNELAN